MISFKEYLVALRENKLPMALTQFAVVKDGKTRFIGDDEKSTLKLAKQMAGEFRRVYAGRKLPDGAIKIHPVKVRRT